MKAEAGSCCCLLILLQAAQATDSWALQHVSVVP